MWVTEAHMETHQMHASTNDKSHVCCSFHSKWSQIFLIRGSYLHLQRTHLHSARSTQLCLPEQWPSTKANTHITEITNQTHNSSLSTAE